MSDFSNIVVIQTAFLGDLILTLPLVQSLKRNLSPEAIDVVVVPSAAGLLAGHPAVNAVIPYDKRGSDSGLQGILRQAGRLRRNRYDLAVVPHRSLRSAGLVWLAKIPRRIGFDTSSARWLYTDVVTYAANEHEVVRNAKLLEPLGFKVTGKELPSLYPSAEDRSVAERFLSSNGMAAAGNLIAIAPGTIWNTKRWLPERYAELAKRLVGDGLAVVLLGGGDDRELCERIKNDVASGRIVSSAGKLSLLQSASLLQRCRLLISNDSAPMHIAVAVRTPVIAIFGATVPEFGFAPCGERDVVIEAKGLACRPCSIHGGDQCPIGTFDCMTAISGDEVYRRAVESIKTVAPHSQRTDGAGRVRG